MEFTRRNRITYYVLFSVVLCVWLCGSNGVESGFKIFRSEHDIFTNLKCSGNACTQSQCGMYGAECVSNDSCKYCICDSRMNTFIRNRNGDSTKGECKSEEEIVPESMPNKRFWLKNHVRMKCLQAQSYYVTGKSCSSFTLDMFWIWTGKTNKQLMNVRTLKCMKRLNSRFNGYVSTSPCKKTYNNLQNMVCKEETNGLKIGWDSIRQSLLHLTQHNYAYSKRSSGHRWIANRNKTQICGSKTTYTGCYRFSDGSFMKYLGYSTKNLKLLEISAPIFGANYHSNCKVNEELKFIRHGKKWKKNTGNIFSIKYQYGNTIKIKFSTMEQFKAWNGSLLRLSVSCGSETHCVLLKLQSLPTYSDIISATPPPSSRITNTKKVSTTTTFTPKITTEKDKDMSFTTQSQTQEGKKEETSSKLSPTLITSTTKKTIEGTREAASESGGTNSATIAVIVTLLLVALALALGYLVYYRKRKRTQTQQNNNNEIGTVNFSKEIYEDPDRIYETLKEDGKEVPPYQPGTYIPASTGQEYIYANDTDLPRSSVGAKPAAKEPTRNGAVYETLEQPGQPTDDDFYNYPDNTNIANYGSSELEYIYAKDTDLPRDTANTKAVRERDIEPATSGGLYHTLEQDGPVSTEQEYSYAKNTDLPSIPQSIAQTSNEHSSPALNTALYHTLEESNPPQPPVYSTLEETEDVENPQVTDEIPNSSDHTYTDVIEDSNSTDSRNSSTTA